MNNSLLWLTVFTMHQVFSLPLQEYRKPLLNITTTSAPILDADVYIYLSDTTFSCEKMIAQFQYNSITIPRDACDKYNFQGGVGQYMTLIGVGQQSACYLCVFGVGSTLEVADGALIENIRRAIGTILQKTAPIKPQKIVISIASSISEFIEYHTLIKEITTTALLAAYHFDSYLTNKNTEQSLLSIIVSLPLSQNAALYDKDIQEGYVVGHAVNQARYWSDLPPCVKTPRWMASEAQRIAHRYPDTLRCTILSEEEILSRGMGGIAAVSRGSSEPCTLVIMEYHASDAASPTIALVGKGVTFDSGGISIKGSDHMGDMKFDMAGGAAVLATMQLIASLRPDHINVVGIVPFTENMPSGSATKPGDIVTFYNGVTAEIINTDAEGRLILADALAYAVKHYELNAIIDIATLTGACMYALGKSFGGVFGTHDVLINTLLIASQQSGDRLWRLPLTADYYAAIQSPVADIANLGSPAFAGATTAACFLSHFVADVPWAHLDIAGPAWNNVAVSYYRQGGATAFGVRLFSELLLNKRYQEMIYYSHDAIAS